MGAATLPNNPPHDKFTRHPFPGAFVRGFVGVSVCVCAFERKRESVTKQKNQTEKGINLLVNLRTKEL